MKKAAPKKMGRPSKRSPAIIEEILLRISKGEPLACICRDKHMPARQKVYEWEGGDKTLSGLIAQARDRGFDALAADCIDIADQTGNDTLIGQNGDDRPDSEWIARSRLRIETRLKLLSKWCPRRYGDKIEVEQTGTTTTRLIMGSNV